LVIAVVCSIGLMLADHRQQHLGTVRALLSNLVAPLHFLANAPILASEWVTAQLSSRNELLTENESLRRHNLRLMAQQQKMLSLESENMRLRDLLDSSFKVGERVLIAELLAVDLDPYRQQVVIDKGSVSGVYPGQAVLDASAVMGQVVNVSTFSSTVLLITDANHALPVEINRNGLRTVAMGTGRINELELPHLPNNADIQEGDLLMTSGLGGTFPAGYPVAEVTKVEQESGRPFLRIRARPNAHLERVREVLLVWAMNPDTILAGGSGGLSGSGGR
jgi:rod shape-determining protein MreC